MNDKAFIAVDVQYDFLEFGALGGRGCNQILRPIVRRASQCDLVIASRDWHPENHCSFKEQGGQWPRHCVRRTNGARIQYDVVGVADIIVSKGQSNYHDEYSAYEASLIACPDLHGIEHLIIGGLCTDYCVKATVLEALENGHSVTVYKDTIAGVSPDTTEKAIADMRRAGAEFK